MNKPYIADAPEHYLEWTMKIKVHKTWIRDGFDLANYKEDTIITNPDGSYSWDGKTLMPDDVISGLKFLNDYAHEHEVIMEIVKAPTPKELDDGQGWDADGEC